MSSAGPRHLVAVVGATTAGKTEVAVALAESLGAELINADSRQAIAELRVGVCKPTSAELRGTVCHGLDWRRLGDRYSAAQFSARALATMEAIWGRGRLPIVVGGTGLYVRGLVRGFDFGRLPPAAPMRGDAAQRLRRVAPAVGERIDLRNPRRVERALALALAGKRPGTSPPPWSALQLGVSVDRVELRRRIAARADRILGPELASEVVGLLARGWSPDQVSTAAIGYREVLLWIEGRVGRDEAVALVTARTWRYARAQLSWWAREPSVAWVRSSAEAERAVAGFVGRRLVPSG